MSLYATELPGLMVGACRGGIYSLLNPLGTCHVESRFE
jgi:hypothetical protein